MLPKILVLLAAAATFGALTSSPASALGGETFGCRVAPGTVVTFNKACNNNTKSGTSFSVAYLVQNQTGSPTYTWTVPAGYVQYISAGSCSTTQSCVLNVPNIDAIITVTVKLTQGTATETFSATASLAQYCGTQHC